MTDGLYQTNGLDQDTAWLKDDVEAEQVVEECLRNIGKKPSFISGTGNKFVSLLMQHIFSRKQAVNMMGDGMRKMYRIKD